MATVKLDPAKGVQIPNMTTTERDAVSSPETGAIVWNTTTSAVNEYNGSAWKEVLRSDGSAASLTAIPAANITGTLPAISAANLTSIPAGNLAGTVADARISALTSSKLTGNLPALNASSLTNIPAANITGTLPAIDGSNLTGLSAADNTPAFSVYISSNQAIAHLTYTTIAYDSELVDTDNCFSTSTYRFTPTTAGYYFVSSNIFFGGQVANALFLNVIFKNSGSNVVSRSISHIAYTENTANTTSGVVYLNGSTDFVYTQIIQTTDSTKNVEANHTNFSGFKLAGV